MPNQATFKVSGFDLFEVAARAMYDFMSRVQAESQLTSPIDTGTLQGSHQIQEGDAAGESLKLTLVTANVDYAEDVHGRVPWLLAAWDKLLADSPPGEVLQEHLQAYIDRG